MKRLIALLAATVVNCQAGLSDLEAISLIESGGNDSAVGEAGEVSRYQILPRVWRSYTRSGDYRNLWQATDVARRHLFVLKRAFEQETGRQAADFDLYVMWNAGLSYYRRHGFSAKKIHSFIRERADRFVNLRMYVSPSHRMDQARLSY